ncbi:response regulator [Paludisphaera mucosa]|uniref:Response regulator n=1 Tax=Paludisphaera mucosa TaxID=3030827 RepID=A0ABT6FHX7_9BACT|nr:response regulator [Paludisphaera mucosa]MDG3007149.1 response regulator [Paludisphaera mucosa]
MNWASPQTLPAPAAGNARLNIPHHLAGAGIKTMTKTVLHADDSGSVRRWVSDQLGGMGLKVVSVADGDAALQYLKDSTCDLLLTDLEMPNLDGLALLAAVRELPTHRFLPVLVLSSKQPGEFDPGRRQGVTGWLVKPVDGEHLRRWVRRVLPE